MDKNAYKIKIDHIDLALSSLFSPELKYFTEKNCLQGHGEIFWRTNKHFVEIWQV